MIGVHFDAVSGSDTRQIVGDFARRIPVALLLPGVASDSYFSLLYGAAGVRYGRDIPTRFRWRAGLLDMNLFRPPFNAGLTLLDYDRSGLPDLYARWLALRTGPSLRLSAHPLRLEARLMGNAGLSTFRFGRSTYRALGRPAASSQTGLDAGYRIQVLGLLGDALSVMGEYAWQHQVGGAAPTRAVHRIRVLLTPHSRIQFYGHGGHEVSTLGGTKWSFHYVSAGLRFIPSATGN